MYFFKILMARWPRIRGSNENFNGLLHQDIPNNIDCTWYPISLLLFSSLFERRTNTSKFN